MNKKYSICFTSVLGKFLRHIVTAKLEDEIECKWGHSEKLFGSEREGVDAVRYLLGEAKSDCRSSCLT